MGPMPAGGPMMHGPGPRPHGEPPRGTPGVERRFPRAVWERAEALGFTHDKVKATVRLDRSPDGIFCDCYVFYDGKELLFLSGINTLRKKEGRRSFLGTRPPLEERYESLGEKRLNIESWHDFEVEKQISDCCVTAVNGFGSVFVTALSYSVYSEAKEFCNKLNMSGKDGTEHREMPPHRGEEPDRCPKCGRPYPDPHRRVCPKCTDRAGAVKRFWFFTKKYKYSVFAVLFAMLLSSALSIISPYISSGFFYDSVLSEGGRFYGQVLLVIGILISTRILSLLVNMVNELISAAVVPKIVFDLKRVLFGSIERLSIGFFTNRQTGALMNQVNGDSDTIYWFFTDGLPNIIINVVQVVGIVIIMLTVNVRLTLLAIAVTPIAVLLTKLIFNRMNKLHAMNYSARRGLSGMLTDVLGGVRVVKAFARENEEKKRFETKNVGLAESDKSVSVNSTVLFSLVTFLFAVSSSAIMYVGGWQVIGGELTYGALITFTAYAGMLYSPLTFFVNMANSASDALNAMQRLMEVMDAEPEVRESEHSVTLPTLCGNIEFDGIGFGYDKSRKIIDGVSFDISAGETVGIVGHTGAGKSTLANLLIRLYDVDEGSIKIDGYDVRELSFETLRSNIAIVSQETYLFQGTVYDNIAYAKPSATRDEVVLAARASGAHEFICKLDDGYSTKIGLGYKELSGGEKQRISIARALLRDPAVLILDEATSAMDTRTERKIQAALDELSLGRTTIMIAHRLSTLRNADKLMVIDNGRLAEKGTHEKLIREKGIYYKLYKLQYEALKNAGIEEA